MASLRPLCRVAVATILPLAAAAMPAQTSQPAAHAASAATDRQPANRTLPLVFESNQGQFPSGVGFVGRTERYSVAVGAQELRFSLPGAQAPSQIVLSLRGSQAAAPTGITEAPFRTNYFLGSDPKGYRTGIRNYTRIGLRHVYPGIDAEFYANGDSIEHDFLLAPGADAAPMVMEIAADGRAATLTPGGDLVIAGGEGELRLKKPVAYQVDAQGKRTEVAAAFELGGSKDAPELRFRLGAYDHTRALVVDPVIRYGTFFDAKAGSTATAVTADAAGDVYLTGYTLSAAPNFGVVKTSVAMPPSVGTTVNAAVNPTAAVFVAKFNPEGSASPVAWLSYFGSGLGDSMSTSIALGAGANAALVAVGGSTTAPNLPTTPGSALPAVTASAKRGFVAALSTSTGSLAASTYLDSAAGDALTGTTEVDSLAIDKAGNVYAVGTATGGGLPTTANAIPVDSTVLTSAVRKGFVYELTPTLGSGALVSYLSGSTVADTSLTSIAVDASGDLFVGGYTAGSFPMAGAYGDANMYVHNVKDPAGNDAFAAELVPTAGSTAIRYSAWFSGSGDEKLNSLALDGSGNLLVFGQTASADLLAHTTYTYAGSTPVSTPAAGQDKAKPVTAAFPAKVGTATLAGFAAKLDPTGKPLVVTYLGGAGDDAVTSGAVDAAGLVYAAGHSSSAQTMGYPKAEVLPAKQDLTGASQQHGFLVQMAGDLSAVKSVANVGGAAGPDTAVGLAVDKVGNAYVGGNISSTAAYTSADAFQGSRSATTGSSAYVAKISPFDASTLPFALTAVNCATVPTPYNPPVGCGSMAPYDPIAYQPPPATAETVTYTFNLTPPGGVLLTSLSAPIAALALSIPAPVPGGVAYSTVQIEDTTLSTDVTAASGCVVTATSVNCPTIPILPNVLNLSYDSFVITLVTAPLSAQPMFTAPNACPNTTVVSPLSGVICITATVSDPTGTYTTPATAQVNSDVEVPAMLSMTAAAATTTGVPVTSIFTNTPTNFTYTVTNAASTAAVPVGDVVNGTFNLTLPTSGPSFIIINNLSYTSTATGTTTTCASITACTGVSIPAGSSITVTALLSFYDASLTTGQKQVPGTVLIGTATGFLSTATATSPNVPVQRGVHLTVTSETISSTPEADGNYYLGDTESFTATVQNVGPSLSNGTETVTVTLPTGFTPTSSSLGTCTASPCTLMLPALQGIALGNNASTLTTFTITGTFPDNTTNSGIGTATSMSFPAVAPALDSSADVDSGAVAAIPTATAPKFNVERYAPLTISAPAILAPGSNAVGITAPATACAGGSADCLYMANSGTADSASYRFMVTNAGPNISLGTTVTVTLPSAPANPAGTNHALVSGPVTVTTPGLPAGSGYASSTAMTCTLNNSLSGAAPAANTVKCTGNLPSGTFLVSGSLTADANTVPNTTAFVNTAAATPGSVAATQTANAAGASPAAQPIPGLEIDRAAHLVTTKAITLTGSSPSSPINLDENAASNSAGVDDAVTVTIKLGATALNSVPAATLVETLPAYFHFITAPTATAAAGGSATCTFSTPTPIVAGSTTGAAGATVTCTGGPIASSTATASSGGTAAAVTTPQITLTYSGKFLDNGTGADITGATAAAKVAQLSITFPAAVASTSVAVDPGTTSDATSGTPALAIQRLVHLYLSKARNTTVNVVPTSFADGTDPNLDEKKTATKFGVNDEIEYDIAVANGGANKALGVQFSDILPPYFTMVNVFLISPGSTAVPDTGANSVPAGQQNGNLTCYQGSSASGTPLLLPFATGGSSQIFTCTYGTSAAPLALNSGPAVAGDFHNAASIELVYQGKFQDNAASMGAADDIPAGASTYTVSSSAGDALVTSAQATDNGTAADRASAALAAYNIQRAAHLTFGSLGVLQTTTAETPLTLNGTTPIIAEAEPSTAGGTPVYNCLRYKVYLQNAGPNVARAPQVSLTTPVGLSLTYTASGTTTTPGSDAPLASNCAYGTNIAVANKATVAGAPLIPTSEVAGSSVVVDADGYFGLNTLTTANSQSGYVLAYTAPTDSGINDSLKGSPTGGLTGAGLTVVNTPFGSGFSVTPFSGATPAQPVALSFTTVTTPGITTVALSTTTTAALPKGTSPDPRYGSINLYRTGTTPRFYALASTAVASASTGMCLTNGSAALPDTFAKPERVLLWDLANLPAGTALGSVPNVTTPYTGDITSSVVAFGGKSYVQAGGPALPYNASNTTLPAVQPQPQMVCGKVNGFATAAAPALVAVLEPVNFSPVITANSSTVIQTPGKGVSEVSFLFPTSHDYNSNDPCYVASSTTGMATRQSCDDNLVLTTRIFGGEGLVPGQTHVIGPLTPDVAVPFVNTTVEVQGGATLYDLVTDQVAELAYRAAGSCDPGIAGGGYAPVNPCATGGATTAALSGMPPQEILFGSGDIAQLTPSVNGGSSALIILPPGATPTSSSTAVASGYTAATATVTAGQTVGFQWRLFLDISGLSGTYNLTCYMVDAATQSIAQPFPAGLSCQVPATITYPNFPAIYIVTQGNLTGQNHVPGWKEAGGVMFATLLVPFLLFRRRLSAGKQIVLMALLFFAGATGLSGCGSGGNMTTTKAVASGTYYFRVSATPVGGGATVTSTAFSVKVVGGS